MQYDPKMELTGMAQEEEVLHAPAGIGRSGVIGRSQVEEAENTLQNYKRGKVNLENRIVDNEQWFKLRHWEQIGASRNPGDPMPASAWLFSSVANKHADAMDNIPIPAVLPRERSDEPDAKILSSVLPTVLEYNNYEQVYSDLWWYKLKSGTAVHGVFWDPKKNNGLGDIDIRSLDLLNLYWEPGITDIQKSRNMFHVELVDKDTIRAQYPDVLDRTLASPTIDVSKYIYDDSVDTSDKTVVVDWYYKRESGGRSVVHYCKFCSGEVLYASENDPAYAQRGYYDHGLYPFVFDTLYPEAGTPAGLGVVDVCKSPQIYIDKLDQVLLKHAVMGARPRFFVRGDGAVNEDEFADWSKDFVHYVGSGNPNESIMPIEIAPLADIYATVREVKIEELKETSGNRDFSQGGTASGVTAASAISALQEAGSKLSRDMIKSSYRAFSKVCELCIELMRQFYEERRWFRVIGETGLMEYVQFTGRQIAQKPTGGEFATAEGFRVPIFDIKVSAQKGSPFAAVAQNERAKELYGMGFFRPDLSDQSLAALEMMDFEGIEKVKERVRNNGTMYQQIQMLQDQMMQMAVIIDETQGTTITQDMAAAFTQGQTSQPARSAMGTGEVETNALGEVTGKVRNSTAGAARSKAARTSTPK